MVYLPKAAFAMLLASLVPAFAAPADSPPPAEPVATVTTPEVVAEPVTTPAVVVPVAVPIPTGLSQIARFEDNVGISREDGTPIGIEMDIYWKGMSLARSEASIAKNHRGLVPNSPPNYASFSSTDEVTEQQGTPQMTTLYDDSTVGSFNLHSFFYGCASKSDDPEPQSCDITVTGFNSKNVQVKQQTFAFEADGTQQQMPQAVTEGFDGLKFVRFELGPPDNNDTAAYIDTVDYEVFGA